jgi:photosystem II stability/assembly factor-like uncharacterized protein
MGKVKIHIFFFLIARSLFGQWQQAAGTSGLNMQSLLTNGINNFAGGEKGAYLSIDGGATYSLSNNGNDAVGPTRGFTKSNNYVFTCTSKGVFRSSDNGKTWVSKSSGISNLLSSGITSAGSILYYVSPTGVFKSSDNAENWSQAGLSGVDVRSISAMKDTLYVGTLSGIYKSVNGGINWISINNGLGSSTSFRAIECKGNTVFAAGPVGTGVYRSTDFGANWTLLGGGLASGSYRGFASNSQLIVAGSFGGGVFYSTDNGNKWSTINSGLTDLTIFDLELNDSYILAATNTQGIFRFPISNLNLSTANTNLEYKNNITIFPNPTSDLIHLRTDNILIGSKYTLFDHLGKSVLMGKIMSENTQIDINNLSVGIYFLNIGEHINRTFKFIKY